MCANISLIILTTKYRILNVVFQIYLNTLSEEYNFGTIKSLTLRYIKKTLSRKICRIEYLNFLIFN